MTTGFSHATIFWAVVYAFLFLSHFLKTLLLRRVTSIWMQLKLARNLGFNWGRGSSWSSPLAGALSAVSLCLHTVPCSFKVGGEFGVQTSYEHGHRPSAPPPPSCVWISLISLSDRGTFQFPLKRLKLPGIYGLYRVLRSCMFLNSDSPDLKGSGFVTWGKKIT